MTVLVIGANGYLGSHVTRQLVNDGQDVRVMVRDGANTIGIDDLKVTRFVGDIWNDDVLREAMTGCDVVYYCVVDTRGWLKDPAPLFHTNVEGTRNVLEVAKDAGLQRFIFTSSYVTVGRKRGRVATEDDKIVDGGEIARRPIGSAASRRTCGPGSRPRSWCCAMHASTDCPRSPCACRPPTVAPTGAGHRTAPSSPGRRSARCPSS